MSNPETPSAKPVNLEASNSIPIPSGAAGNGRRPEARTRALRRAFILSVVALAIIACALESRPAYAKLKSWHSRARASESLQLTSQGKLEGALTKAREAWILCNSEPQAIRAMATVLSALGEHRDALQWWHLLLAKEPVTAADRAAAVDAALNSGNLEDADAQLALMHDAHTAAALQLTARCKIAHKDRAAALEAIYGAIALEPANAKAQLFLARLLFDSKLTHEDGVRRLHALALLKDRDGLDALMTLTTDRDASIESARLLAAALKSHPLAKDFHRIEALRLELICNPAQQKDLLDQAQVQFADASPECLRQFALLLVEFREIERVLVILPLERTLGSKELFKLHLDALASLHRWEELLAILQKEKLPMPEPIVLLFQARCEGELGRSIQARVLWSAAIRTAGTDTTLLTAMREHAVAMSNFEQAQLAGERLAELAASGRGAALDAAQQEYRKQQLGSGFTVSTAEIASRKDKLRNEFAVDGAEADGGKKRFGLEFTASDAEVKAAKEQLGLESARR